MQLLLFISGLGILLLAMRLLEKALATLGGGQLRLALESFTSSPLRGLLLGVVTTGIMQSSTIVGLMTMAFVGSGVLPLRNAIGIILGCNLGSTFTGWLVAWLGFSLELDSFYAMVIGSGALLTVAAADGSRLQEGGRFLFALGLLFLALVLMKDSIGFVVELVDIGWLQTVPLFGYFLFGALLSALIHSSAATVMITLSALSAGIIDMQAAGALVIGADLGTTSTIIIGSLSGSIIKRQIALVHFLFNLATDLTAFLCLPLLLTLVSGVFGISDPLFALVALHSSFNLFGILVFLPLAGQLQRFVEARVPLPAQQVLRCSEVTVEVPVAAFQALEQDVRTLLRAGILLNAWRLGLLPALQQQRGSLLPDTEEAAYSELKRRENLLSDYILDLQRRELTPQQAMRAQQLLVCIRDTLYAAKAVKDAEADVRQFKRLGDGVVSGFLDELLQTTGAVWERALGLLEQPGGSDPEALQQLLGLVLDSHARSNTRIYELIDRGGFARDSASSALNINRELLLAGHSLVNALEHCLLPGEQARTVSALLNLQH